PPIVRNPSVISDYELEFKEIDYTLTIEKESRLKDKICPECDSLPAWLNFDSRLYLVKNLQKYINSISSKVRLIRAYVKEIKDNLIITNKQALKFDTAYVTILNESMERNKANSIDCLLTIILNKRNNSDTNWKIYIN
ncbi:hypothetical protein, partial [Acidianus sp. RZ1]|uniref:hypothetical protein n=1 Tax=Acidianus sp. RZ1 TaxID=1540082 RepID=UPI0014921A58